MNAINPSGLWKKRLGDWALNPYVGCEHKCFHCYVPTMPGSALFSGPVIDEEGVRHEKPPPRKQTDWGNYIYLKDGFVEALARQLKNFTPEVARERALLNRKNIGPIAGLTASERAALMNAPYGAPWYDPGWILVSFLTDCYTHLEGKFKVTRQCLELLLAAGHKVRIQTRSAMVERDFDILAAYPGQVLLGTSLPYMDDDVARALEPKSSSPTRRLQMLGKASRARIPCYVAVAPLMPFTGWDELRALYGLLTALPDIPPFLELREIFCEVLNPKGENLGMMQNALSEAWLAAPASSPEAHKFAEHFLCLKRYNEDAWAARTDAVGRFLSSHFPVLGGQNESDAGTSKTKFIFWPDSLRGWARHLGERQNEFLDRFLPPKG